MKFVDIKRRVACELDAEEIAGLTESLVEYMLGDEEFQQIVAGQFALTFDRDSYYAFMSKGLL